MPKTRPQPEDQRPFAIPYEHNWVDITTINSPDNEWICAGCGITVTEPKTHWPLYPEDTCSLSQP